MGVTGDKNTTLAHSFNVYVFSVNLTGQSPPSPDLLPRARFFLKLAYASLRSSDTPSCHNLSSWDPILSTNSWRFPALICQLLSHDIGYCLIEAGQLQCLTVLQGVVRVAALALQALYSSFDRGDDLRS